MAKRSGLGMRFLLDGYDLSGDTRELGEIGGGYTPIENTDITKSAFERIGGVRDGRTNWVSYFNDATGQAHSRLSSLPLTDRLAMTVIGSTIGSPAANLNGKQINYDPTRAATGELTIAVNAQANSYGLEWGELVTAVERTDTAATNGAGVDFAASTSFGLQAYLQAGAFTGTDATVKLQHSSDNGSTDPYADITGGAFTQITSGRSAQRIQTARNLTVKRYIRAVTVTTGGFASLAFTVCVAKNDVEVTF